MQNYQTSRGLLASLSRGSITLLQNQKELTISKGLNCEGNSDLYQDNNMILPLVALKCHTKFSILGELTHN